MKGAAVGPEFCWYLPSGHGGERGDGAGARTGLPYWIQVAQAVEYAGFDALFLPAGTRHADPWMVAAALSRTTRTLRFVMSVEPSTMAPAVLAHTAYSMQSITGGRLALHMDVDYRPDQQRAYGVFVNRDQHHEQMREFIEIYRALWDSREGLDCYRGQYFQLASARLPERAMPAPPLHLSGRSAGALRLIARHADVDVQPLAHPRAVGERIDALRAQVSGRRFACRAHVIARNTEQAAWRDAGPAVQPAQAGGSAGTHANIRWLRDRAPGASRRSEIYPNVGAALAPEADGPVPEADHPLNALIGSYGQVAARLAEFHALGVGCFVLSGTPSLEEVFRVGEELLPLVRAA